MSLVPSATCISRCSLGAMRVDDWPYPEDADLVLRDPDGNEFCIIDYHDLE